MRLEHDTLIIELKFYKQNMLCPICESNHIKFYSYQYKKIIHSISTHQKSIIRLHHRKYQCRDCKKIFYESNRISDTYENISLYTKTSILNYLKDYNHTFTSAAHHYYVSVQTVINIFDHYVEAKRRRLPIVVNIDEVFISRAHKYKYAFVLYDFMHRKIIDALPTRHKRYLIDYFARISKTELSSE